MVDNYSSKGMPRSVFIYVSTGNVALATALLSKYSIESQNSLSIQDGITEFRFSVNEDLYNKLFSEIRNNSTSNKLHLTENPLSIEGAIGSPGVTISGTTIQVASTDGTAANGKLIKCGATGEIILGTSANTIGNVGLAAGTTVQVGEARTAAHTAVSIGATSTLALAANVNRNAAMLINDSDETIYIKIGSAAVLNQGIRLNSNGGSYEMSKELGNLSTAAINAISTSGSKNIIVTEFV